MLRNICAQTLSASRSEQLFKVLKSGGVSYDFYLFWLRQVTYLAQSLTRIILLVYGDFVLIVGTLVHDKL